MAASVRIDDLAFSDLRYEHLGSLIGTDRFGALGRMAYLWHQCTEKQTYVLPDGQISVYIDPEKLIKAELGERVDGGVRIKGTNGRIEWLGKLREGNQRGGLARANNAKRGKNGTWQ